MPIQSQPGAVETMAFNTTPAWHGLGLDVGGECRDSNLAMQAAGLDWSVDKRDVFTKATDGRSFQSVPGTYGVVRSDTQRAVGIVGSHYTALQNRDAFAFFDPILNELGGCYETAGSLHGGSRVWVLVRLAGELRIKGNDVVKKYALLANSHDGDSRVSYGFTGIRVCCTNTLKLALSDYEAFGGSRHRLNVASNVAAASGIMRTMADTFLKAEATFKAMANIHLNPMEANAYFRKVYERPVGMGWRAEERLQELWNTGRGNSERGIRGTLWAAYNAVTEYEDYKEYYADDAPARRLTQVWWGIGAKLKYRALAVGRKVTEGTVAL